jgi:hypothetical protein
MKERTVERIYKSTWHALIAAVGIFELRNHRTKFSKVLACGLIAFHVDAALADALDVPTTAQRLLHSLIKEKPKIGNGDVGISRIGATQLRPGDGKSHDNEGVGHH